MKRMFILFVAGMLSSVAMAAGWKMQPIDIPTRWAASVGPDHALPEYPRPQLVRDNWRNLNGLWSYAITDGDVAFPTTYDGEILVPYPVESALSGVKRQLMPDQLLWYRRTFDSAEVGKDERVLLNFGAVDWRSTVYLNGQEVGGNAGGYRNFSIDISKALRSGTNELIVKICDPTEQGPNPRGKQVLHPEGIMYTASSGIWQTVWIERVPQTYIAGLKTTPDVDKKRLILDIDLNGDSQGHSVEVTAKDGNRIVAKQNGVGTIDLQLKKPRLWSPDTPFLYDLEVRLLKDGVTVDRISSYFGMRKVELRKDALGSERIFLNGKYTYNLGTLDQGFWPEGLHTAPTDAALKFDIEAAKAVGFNTIRKHVKVEPARWYYHCDKLGMMIWQDIVPPGARYGTTDEIGADSRLQFERELAGTLEQLHNYPSIISWVLFNEGWGAYDVGRLTRLIKETDPTRLVNGMSGVNLLHKESPAVLNQTLLHSDMVDLHNYPPPSMPERLPGKAQVIGEFGGIGVFIEGHVWQESAGGFGYVQVGPNGLAKSYGEMLATLSQLAKKGVTASIYTQLYDVEGEQNGLLTYDRRVVKLPPEKLRQLHEKIIPAASNFAMATRGFTIETAASVDEQAQYAARLAEYLKGNGDDVFLRRLTWMAIRLNDQERATEIGNEYINRLPRPYTKEALTFIYSVTRTTKDKGFELLRVDPEPFNQIYGENKAQQKIKAIIDAERRNSE